MSQDLIKQLKAVKEVEGRINPDQSWVVQNKERLMTQIGNTTVEAEEKFHFTVNNMWQAVQILLPGRVAYNVVRPLAVFLLIFSITASGWITTVGATQNSLPGDIVYGVKVAVNNLTKDNIEVATDIAKDVKKVAQKKQDNTTERLAVGVEYLKKSLDLAKEDVKKSTETDMVSADAIAQTQKVSEATKEINQNLEEAKQQMDDTTQTAVMDEAKKIVVDTALAVVENILQKKEEGKIELVDNEAVKNLVTDQINNLENIVSTVSSTAQDLNLTNSTMTASGTVSNVTNTISEAVNNTNVVQSLNSTSTATVQQMVDEAVKKVNVTGQNIIENIATAKELVGSDKLLEAIQKVKEGNQASQDAQKTIDVIQQTVKQVTENVVANNLAQTLNNSIVASTTVTSSVVVPVVVPGIQKIN
ncbi:MAG TPA: hypothetical protein DEB09_05355 [Candidatus Magasanikbacteria bacterium]|nr:hypothetical protein [Candidatus Magasanikbacteria bacterium]